MQNKRILIDAAIRLSQDAERLMKAAREMHDDGDAETHLAEIEAEFKMQVKTDLLEEMKRIAKLHARVMQICVQSPTLESAVRLAVQLGVYASHLVFALHT